MGGVEGRGGRGLGKARSGTRRRGGGGGQVRMRCKGRGARTAVGVRDEEGGLVRWVGEVIEGRCKGGEGYGQLPSCCC